MRHKWWADLNLLQAVASHLPAAEDGETRKLLHPILIANRYWLLLTLNRPFIDEQEAGIPDSHTAVIESFLATASSKGIGFRPQPCPILSVLCSLAPFLGSSSPSPGASSRFRCTATVIAPSALRDCGPWAALRRPWILSSG